MNIVCIGGGHGLSRVLSALKQTHHSLTAIITTTDNGGSTGRLRKNTNQIAFGDIRRCVSALADPNTELANVNELRFSCGQDLKDHCFGNLLLVALNQHYATPTEAVEKYCEIMGVKHRVLPMSDENTNLVATNKQGLAIYGEVNIEKLNHLPKSVKLSTPVSTTTQVISAIEQADLVLLGPGSLITSVLPPLLIEPIKNALMKTTACRVFIENLQPENGVMARLDMPLQALWACHLIGYQFFDITLSADAFGVLGKPNVRDTKSGYCEHNEESIRQIINELAGEPKLDYSRFIKVPVGINQLVAS